MTTSGWGQFPKHKVQTAAPRDVAAVAGHVVRGPLIARGQGRAYGDSALNCNKTLETRHLNRIISFDGETGTLVAEAGVILGDVIDAFLPRGWFPYVTPGTKFVSLGGMVAADVHGKNHHHQGSFRSCVDWIEIIAGSGEVIRTMPGEDMFDWSFGGMGLTGVIIRLCLRLQPVESAWISQTTVPAANLDAAMAVFEQNMDAPYSVAWIDCLSRGSAAGRSLVMLGAHANRDDLRGAKRKTPYQTPEKRKKTLPFTLPGLMNGTTVKAFNALYYRNGVRNAGTRLVDWDSYFYPLDAILGWNRVYGRKGFMQFQCALPLETSRDGLRALLKAIRRAGAGSFLAVLKRFGDQDGRFSFPMPGYTLALDFPVNPTTTRLMERLDTITLEHGGRFYLAKDARMRAETFRASDPRIDDFLKARDALGANGFQSEQSKRLKL